MIDFQQQDPVYSSNCPLVVSIVFVFRLFCIAMAPITSASISDNVVSIHVLGVLRHVHFCTGIEVFHADKKQKVQELQLLLPDRHGARNMGKLNYNIAPGDPGGRPPEAHRLPRGKLP